MKSTKQQSDGAVDKATHSTVEQTAPRAGTPAVGSGIWTAAPRDHANPVDYRHPDEWKRLGEALALGFDCNRTRHADRRQIRLVHEHFGCVPEGLTEL